jgi:glyoxylase-like metal-dependent hydrolase (beta-lactamase superfamily II)
MKKEIMMTTQQPFTIKDWLITRQIDVQTWAINDRGEDICYFVCGDSRCLLIDTGWGIGDLKALVTELSPIPLTVVNTHGHPDHTFGNWQFTEVHIAEADIPLVSEVPSLAMRSYIAEEIISSPLPEDFDISTWMVGDRARLIPIQEGDVFDLGNRTLEVITIPGHSPGSIAFLDSERRWLFSGDTFFEGTIWLHLQESLPLSAFCDSLMHLQERVDEFDIMYPAHGELDPLGLSPSMINDMVVGLGKIIDGTLKGEPESTFAGDGLRCDFETFSIIYLPDRL